MEEMLPAGVPLEIRLGLSNPVISPTQKDNIWSFRAFSRASGFDELLNVNLNVTGFKVFGEFSLSYAVATVLAPVSPSILAVWIKLKSELRPEDGVNNLVRIWYPKAFQPRPGLGDFCQDFQLFHDPNREGVAGFTAVSTETATVTYLPIPSGTECFHFYDQQSGLIHIHISLSLSIYIYIYIYISISIYLSLYIYIYRERDLSLSLCIYIYVYVHVSISISLYLSLYMICACTVITRA